MRRAPFLAISLACYACSGNLTGPQLSHRVLSTPEGSLYRAHEVVVSYSGDASQLQIAVERLGAAIIEANDPLSKRLGFYRLALPDSIDADAAIKALAKETNVTRAERNYIVSPIALPNDPEFSKLWGMTKIAAQRAWDLSTGGDGVLISISDTGIDYNHPDLKDNIWSNPQEIPGNGIDDDNNGYIDDIHGWDWANNDNDPIDDHYHGTHVAGTIGASGNNGIGVAGVAWKVKLQAAKFLSASGSGTTWAGAQTILYAAATGAKAVNASWGCQGCYTTYIEDAITALGESGGLLIAAAGNSGTNNDQTPFYPASHTNDNVIAVAASDSGDNRAYFSCYGKTTVDIAAPGTSILSSYPANQYRYLQGTSMAAPHVSGAVALVASIAPTATHQQIKEAILSSGDAMSAFANITVSGRRLNVDNLLRAFSDDLPPQAPSGFGVVHTYGLQARASWQASPESDLGSYRVRWGTQAGQYTAEMTVAVDQTTALIEGLSHGQTYYFVVHAVDRFGNVSLPSNEETLLIQDLIAPPQVIDLQANTLSGQSVRGSVAASSGEFSSNWPASAAHDGSPQTAWMSAPRSTAQEEYLIVDLLKPTSIDRVALLPNPAYPELYPLDFDIEISQDGAVWHPVAGRRNAVGEQGKWETILFPAIVASHVRLRVIRSNQHPSGLYYASLAELSVIRVSAQADTLQITFTAPGDDPGSGAAVKYDLRYATTPITAQTFDAATAVQTPTPKTAGSWELALIDKLAAETRYYFALKAIDRAGNVSPMSNVAEATTVVIPPSTVSDLRVSGTTDSTVTLVWTAPGSDGIEGRAESYDLRYSEKPITASNFIEATSAGELPQPGIVGAPQHHTVGGLTLGKLYYFAIRAIDQSQTPGGISNVVTAQPSDGTDDTPPAAVVDLSVNKSIQDLLSSAQIVDASESFAGYGANALVDGQSSTFWWTKAGDLTTPAHVVFDLQQSQPLTRLRLHRPQQSASQNGLVDFPEDFSFSLSADAVTWTPVVQIEGFLATKAEWYSWAIPVTHARYVRLDVTKRRSQYVGIAEFEARSVQSDTGLVLSWAAPGDDGWVGTASSYELRRATSQITEQNFAGAELLNANAPQSAGMIEFFPIAQSAAETEYFFAIKAIDDAGNKGALSNVVKFVTPVVPPAAISDLRSVNVTKSSVTLKFTASGDDGLEGVASAYDLRYSVEPISAENFQQATSVNGLAAPQPAGAEETITVNNLGHSTLYYFALKAKDDAGASSLISNVLAVLTGDGVPPAAVSDLVAATVDPSQDSALKLTIAGSSGQYSSATSAQRAVDDDATTHWMSPARSSHQTEYLHFDLGGSRKLAKLRLRPSANYLDLFPVDFALQVRTASSDDWTTIVTETNFSTSGGWQDWNLGAIDASEARLLITKTNSYAGKYYAVIADAQLQRDPSDYTTIRLSWTAPGNNGDQGQAAAYDVRRSGAPIDELSFPGATAIPGAPVPATAGSLERFEVGGLQPQQTYCFALRAEDGSANLSSVSNYACATTPAIPPRTISDLSVSGQTPTTLALSWTAPGDDGDSGKASAYQLRYATSRINDATWDSATPVSAPPIPQSAGQSESYTVVNLDGATRYYFAIRAVGSAGELSAISNIASGSTLDGAPPSTIIDLALATVGSSDGAILLTWSAPRDGTTGKALTYDVRISEQPIDASNFAAATKVTAGAPKEANQPEQLIVSGLRNEALYYAAIRSSDGSNNTSALSNVASGRTRDKAPAAVSDLSAVGGDGKSSNNATLLVSWTAPGDDGDQGTAKSYELRYSTTPIYASNFAQATAVNPQPIPKVAKTTQQHTISGLLAGQRYYVALRSEDDRGNASALSNVLVATTPDEIKPQRVDDLLAETANCNGCVKLSWTERGDNDGAQPVASYQIAWSTEAINESNFASANQLQGPIGGSIGQPRSYTVSLLPDETRLFFAIRALDAAGNHALVSNSAAAWTPDVAPAAIVDIAQTAKTTTTITLSFTAPGDNGEKGTAQSYDLRYSSAPINAANFAQATSAPAPTPQVAGSKQSATISGLAGNTNYYVAIKSRDDRGNWSPISNVPMVGTTDNTAPGQIDSVAAVSGNGTGTIKLSWVATGDDGGQGRAHHYEMRYAKLPVTAGSWAAATPISGLPAPKIAGSGESYTVTGLEGETTYHFALRAVDEDGNAGPLSASVSAMTAAIPPAMITTLTAVAGPNSVTLTWTAPGDDGDSGTAESYDVRFAEINITPYVYDNQAVKASGEPTPKVARSVQSMTISNLKEQTTYYFAIKTVDDQGAISMLSNVASVTTPDLTAPAAPASLVVKAADPQGPLLLPLSAEASSSLGGSWNPAFAVDEDAMTSWASAGSEHAEVKTLTVDLGESQPIERIRLRPDGVYRNLFPRDFELQVSGDKRTWKTVATEEQFSIDNGDWLVWGFAPQTARYLRVSCFGQAHSYGRFYAALAEVEAYGAGPTDGRVILTFVAPGDDGTIGTASRYEVYRHTAPFDQSTLGQAEKLTQVDTPQHSGTLQSLTVDGMAGETTYYWAVRAIDEAGNVGALSAIVEAATNAVAPSPIADLAGSNATRDSVTLSWSAPGDDGLVGTAQSYELRYADFSITAASFALATKANGLPTPASAGTQQMITLGGLKAGTVYRFAIVARDEAGTTSQLSNVVVLETQSAPDHTAPAAIGDLVVTLPDRSDRPLAATIDSVSSEQTGFEANAVIDDSPNTMWASAARTTADTEESIALDLGQVRSLGGVRIWPAAGFENLFPENLSLQVSSNKLDWQTVLIRTNYQAKPGQPLSVELPATSARYVKLVAHKLAAHSSGYFYAVIDEISPMAPQNPDGTAVLSWTATGDDADQGQAAAYDLRRSFCPFDQASSQAVTTHRPLIAGAPERYLVSGLAKGVHCFAIVAEDEAGNRSGVSNIGQVEIK